jgi:hypothetical protein
MRLSSRPAPWYDVFGQFNCACNALPLLENHTYISDLFFICTGYFLTPINNYICTGWRHQPVQIRNTLSQGLTGAISHPPNTNVRFLHLYRSVEHICTSSCYGSVQVCNDYFSSSPRAPVPTLPLPLSNSSSPSPMTP